MNHGRLMGTLDEAMGTMKQKAGEFTHDTPLQVEALHSR
jgi:hypothetical protein